MTKNKTIEIDCPYVYWPFKYVLLQKCQFKIYNIKCSSPKQNVSFVFKLFFNFS